jgi:hypothetical protein
MKTEDSYILQKRIVLTLKMGTAMFEERYLTPNILRGWHPKAEVLH